MENEGYQKELFEFEKPKRAFPGFGKIFPKDKAAITITLEKAVFILIGLVMVMVIIYALGVEKGKSLVKRMAPAIASQPVVKTPPSAVLTKTPAAPAQTRATPAMQNETKREGGPYTIVAVTFTRKDTASAEVNRLAKEGFDVFAVPSDSYFIVCIGAYPDRESARPSLNKVKRIYKDAYVKLR